MPSRKRWSSSRSSPPPSRSTADASSSACRGAAGEQVGDRVGVAAHEVHRTVQQRFRPHQPGDLLPPAPGHARIPDLGAPEHPHSHRHAVLGHLGEPGPESHAPDLVQLSQSYSRPPQALAASPGVRSSMRSTPEAWSATLSLFSSIWSATIVGMRSSTSEALAIGRRASLAVVVPAPPPAGCAASVHHEGAEPALGKDVGRLAHDDGRARKIASGSRLTA